MLLWRLSMGWEKKFTVEERNSKEEIERRTDGLALMDNLRAVKTDDRRCSVMGGGKNTAGYWSRSTIECVLTVAAGRVIATTHGCFLLRCRGVSRLGTQNRLTPFLAKAFNLSSSPEVSLIENLTVVPPFLTKRFT